DVGLSNAGEQIMQPAHLEAVAYLPDAVEHRTVTLVIGRETPLAAQIRRGREGRLREPAERLGVRVPEARQRIRRRRLPVIAESLREAGLQRMICGAAQVRIHRHSTPV